MLELGALGFATPWVLAGLLALPVIWWLIRVTPPGPKRISFPPVRLLQALLPKQETPARTPLWLLIFRLALAALAILALSEPVLNPAKAPSGQGPLMLVIDDGWPSATRWRERMAEAETLIDQAARTGRSVIVQTTAPSPSGEAFKTGSPMPANEARNLVAALKPKPWAADRMALARSLPSGTSGAKNEIIWLCDGIDDGEGNAFALAERLLGLGSVEVRLGSNDDLAKVLLPPVSEGTRLKFEARRAVAEGALNLTLKASADGGRVIAREPFSFGALGTAASVVLDLPSELRNQITRVEIEDAPSASTTILMDERWRRRPVGLVSGASLEARQPLLSDIHYLDRALAPFAEVRTGTVSELLRRDLAILILADVGKVIGDDFRNLEDWVKQGGVLVRFAGPRTSEQIDALSPVKLRAGSRQLGGAMSWAQPARIAPFAEGSPFAGLGVPEDVLVHQQVLAQPDATLAAKTWARLEDGTPLVTAERREKGSVVLVHITANTQWSNLPLSGLFVDMLRRLVDLSHGLTNEGGDRLLPPLVVLDGFGRLSAPGGIVAPLPAAEIGATIPSPRHPPGFYGSDEAKRALNLARPNMVFAAISDWPADIRLSRLSSAGEIDLKPWLLAFVMAMLLADILIGFAMRGLIRIPALAAAVMVIVGVFAPEPAEAQRTAPNPAEDFAMQAALDLRFAFVRTFDREVDEISQLGLQGLTEAVFRRTSVEAGDPMGIDIERDDITLFPILYWPITANQRDLSDKAVARVDTFLKTGGLILFDTRDATSSAGGAGTGPGEQKLRQLLARLDIPPLMPVPSDHVLTKTFYLLQEFPGRFTGGTVWVERQPGGGNDGVSSIVIGSHDWAGAWALDKQGRALAPLVPGLPRQREMAYRFGVNLVIYALTGNYKADQVHVPAILERLGN